MREILFRGKRISVEGKWVVGSLFPREKGYTEIFEHKETEFAGRMIEGMWRKVFPRTVGQYTGLHDKNGKRIFEGDVVKVRQDKTPGTATIYYGNGAFFGYAYIWKHPRKNIVGVLV